MQRTSTFVFFQFARPIVFQASSSTRIAEMPGILEAAREGYGSLVRDHLIVEPARILTRDSEWQYAAR